jgi:hypothetical protein
MLENGTHSTVAEIAAAEKVNESYVGRVLRRAVLVVRTPDGLRALSGGWPISPTSVQRYLQGKFGDSPGPARAAIWRLARSMPPKTLAANGYALYVNFRPGVPTGVKGWGQEASSI